MEGFTEFIVYLLQLICPQPCFDEIFIKHDFLNGIYYAFCSVLYILILMGASLPLDMRSVSGVTK